MGKVAQKRNWPAITAFIKANLNKKIQVKDLRAVVYLSGEAYFKRKFREAFGTSPRRYVLDIRLAHARQLLLTTDLKIDEIADICGWDYPSNFVKAFRSRQGEAPRAYRLRHLSDKTLPETLVQGC